VEPLFDDRSNALLIDIQSARKARRLSIDAHPESHRAPSRCRSHDEMEIAGVKLIDDTSIGLVEHRGPLLDGPIAGERPAVEPQSRGRSIDTRLIERCTTGRCKALGAFVADIVFLRLQVRPVRRRLDAAAFDRNEALPEADRSGLRKQSLNELFRFLVRALAKLLMPDAPLRIDE
jgi:hypothetical protein